jgi:hypothetical protein
VPTIPIDTIDLHPSSTGTDLDGRLFEWEGGLYRGVRPRFADEYRALAQSDAYAALVERGLAAPTAVTDYVAEGFPLVLRHERVEFVTYPFEWPWPMLKDAGLAVLDLNLALIDAGYIVKDPSAWNVLFEGPQPVYVDFTNIWRLGRLDYARETWPEWFRAYYTHPLRLVAEGNGRAARTLLHDYERGISLGEYLDLGIHLRARVVQRARSLERRARRRFPRPAREWRDVVLGLRRELARIDVPVPVTKWSKYYDLSLSPAAPVEGLTAKHENVRAVLEEMRPRTVVDIGPATGWYSRLAAETGARVVGLEDDESAASRLYVAARDGGLDVHSVVMDITRPTTAYGLLGARVAAASERLAGELALALAIVHHLVHGMGLELDQVAGSLAPFAGRRLLVEWIEFEDEASHSVYKDRRPDYTVEALTSALGRRGFRFLRRLDSHPATRSLLLFERG